MTSYDVIIGLLAQNMHKKCWRQQRWDNMERPNIFFRKVLFRYFPMRVQPFLYDKWFGSYARSNVGHWPFSCSWRENITFPYTFIYSCLTTAKHMQMTSNLNTSKIKIIKTIPESLAKIRRHDVVWHIWRYFPIFVFLCKKKCWHQQNCGCMMGGKYISLEWAILYQHNEGSVNFLWYAVQQLWLFMQETSF